MSGSVSLVRYANSFLVAIFAVFVASFVSSATTDVEVPLLASIVFAAAAAAFKEGRHHAKQGITWPPQSVLWLGSLGMTGVVAVFILFFTLIQFALPGVLQGLGERSTEQMVFSFKLALCLVLVANRLSLSLGARPMRA